MSALFHLFLRLWLVVLLAIGLAGAGTAHRTPLSAADLALADYLSAGGLLSDICGSGSGHESPVKCDACRLMAAIVPISESGAERPVSSVHVLAFVPRARHHAPTLLRTAHLPRAPPVV